MFNKIVHASDGSEHAFHALTLALAIAQQNKSELHMVCVEEVPYLSESFGEAREVAAGVADRIEGVFRRARAMAENYQVEPRTHLIKGRPVPSIVNLSADLDVDLLVIGAVGHSALFERMIGSKADRIVQLAHCPVLVGK